MADSSRQQAPHPRRPAPRPRSGAAHPGPTRVALPAAIRDAVVAHARAELPNESCGLIAGTAPAAEGGTAIHWYPTRNRAASPFRYEIDPDDLVRVSLAIDDAGQVIWGIVHSHVRSLARPSATDVGLAFYPEALYVLVSLAEDQADPGTGAGPVDPGSGAGPVDPGSGAGPADAVTGAASLRAWRILDGAVFEVGLDVA